MSKIKKNRTKYESMEKNFLLFAYIKYKKIQNLIYFLIINKQSML